MDSVVASLTKDESHKQQEYNCNILDKPNYTGDYTDHLTFDIAFQDTAYNITYETNGGTITEEESAEGRSDDHSNTGAVPGRNYSERSAGTGEKVQYISWLVLREACTRYVDSKDPSSE